MSRFPLRLVGTLPQGGTAGNDLILARAYGATIRQLGGVPYGASGSPVYQGNRLLGAISTVFAPDNYLVGITPIEAMLALAKEPSLAAPASTTGDSMPKLPIVSYGVSSRKALQRLEEHYGEIQAPMSIKLALKQLRTTRLRNGDSIGAALMTGDIQMGYIGTATLVQGKQAYAFGHPLLFTGPTNIPLTLAPIITTARGDWPQKVGSFGNVMGTIIQDRGAGVLAELNTSPLTVHMLFTIQDTDRQKTTTVVTQAAQIKSELPFLTFIATLESMQRAMNRVGAGSAAWQWRVFFQEAVDPLEVVFSQTDTSDIGFVVAVSGESIVNEALATGRSLKAIELAATVTSQAE